jgi:hypothetical protein
VFTPCETIDSYVDLWVEYAGDQNLLDEIIDHKSICPICLANMLEAEHGTKIEPESQDELLPVERRDIGAWLDQEAVRLGIVEVKNEIS